jgi:hypothetical protein
MGRKSILPGWVLVGLLLAGGCSGSDKPPHLEQNPTFGQACNDLWTTFCQHAIDDCSIYTYGTTTKDCVDTNAPACCQNVCSTIGGTSQAQVDKCRSVLSTYSCDALAQNQSPPECQGVLHY